MKMYLMDKVWAVEEGEYSDYHIVGVFSTKENAQIVADLFNGSVVEWPLDPGIEELNAGLQRFQVFMYRDGSAEVESLQRSSYAFPVKSESEQNQVIRSIRLQKGNKSWIVPIVWAKDKKHAVKIANERRVQLIAHGKWPEDEKLKERLGK